MAKGDDAQEKQILPLQLAKLLLIPLLQMRQNVGRGYSSVILYLYDWYSCYHTMFSVCAYTFVYFLLHLKLILYVIRNWFPNFFANLNWEKDPELFGVVVLVPIYHLGHTSVVLNFLQVKLRYSTLVPKKTFVCVEMNIPSPE